MPVVRTAVKNQPSNRGVARLHGAVAGVEVGEDHSTSLPTGSDIDWRFSDSVVDEWEPGSNRANRTGTARLTARERDHSGRRYRHPPAPDHPRGQQATAARLRQADDLLPDLGADARRHPRHPRHHDAARSATSSSALLGDGSQWGSRSATPIQPSPDGLAQAFLIGADHVAGDRAALVLGDNIFFGHGMGGTARATPSTPSRRIGGCTLFGYRVSDPERYGVAVLDAIRRGWSTSRRSRSTRARTSP